jgi:hypothetical protein
MTTSPSFLEMKRELECGRKERQEAMSVLKVEKEAAKPWWLAVKEQLDALEGQIESLKKENAALRQQVQDLTCNPARPDAGPLTFCSSCGEPAYTLLNHVCKE